MIVYSGLEDNQEHKRFSDAGLCVCIQTSSSCGRLAVILLAEISLEQPRVSPLMLPSREATGQQSEELQSEELLRRPKPLSVASRAPSFSQLKIPHSATTKTTHSAKRTCRWAGALGHPFARSYCSAPALSEVVRDAGAAQLVGADGSRNVR